MKVEDGLMKMREANGCFQSTAASTMSRRKRRLFIRATNRGHGSHTDVGPLVSCPPPPSHLTDVTQHTLTYKMSVRWDWVRRQPTDNNSVDMNVFPDRVLLEHTTDELREYLYFFSMLVIITDETLMK